MGGAHSYAAEAAQVAYESESDRERITRELREQIRDGRLAPGAQLPSAFQLSQRYGVSERTAQDAVRALKAEGLAFGRRGRGVYVGSGTGGLPVRPVEEDGLTLLREELAQLQAQQATTHAHLLELYDRLGQPRPGAEPVQPRRARRSPR